VLRSSDQGVYDAIATVKGPISFQTDSPENMGCLWTQTVAEGVLLGASSIEIWPETRFQGFDSFALAEVKELADELTTPIPVGNPMPLPKPCSGFH
jgi:hypothetical protein